MPKYKLIYFNVKGRAESTRYLFALAGQEYEDYRIDREKEWPELKKSLPTGQVPVLEVDGVQIPQSGAIVRFVARELGLYGSNNLEAAQIDVAFETMMDIGMELIKIFHAEGAKKAEILKQVQEEKMPKFIAMLEKLLVQNKGGDGWFVGDKPSSADAGFFFYAYDLFPSMGIKLPDNTPKLKGLVSRFGALPQIAEYIKKRPVTDH